MRKRAAMDVLPVTPLLPRIDEVLARHGALVLVAPPGAGKTTRVPLALLEAEWLAGQGIILLEPRRLAARAAARHMARLLGEAPGARIGYRVRLESRVGPQTRVEVVTEGILTRRLQDDPALDGVGLVIFDEFHERSLEADLALSLVLDLRQALRPDLRVLVMSATLDGAAVARLLGDAPVIESEGRAYPVETRHLEAPPRERLAPAMAEAVRRALAESEGDILAFLPGEREIRATARLLEEASLPAGVVIALLYGALPPAAQDLALAPAPAGARKIVLATSIAETSLTIEGVRVVIDGGFARVPRYDPVTGLTRLETVRVSQDAAAQRRGRAGRLGPGLCYRLWPEAATRGLPPRATPEILQADLAPLALALAAWGVRDPGQLAWLDPPPTAAYAQATALLRQLSALETDGRISAHGRALARLPMHPRLGHMALVARERGLGPEAVAVAALLEEGDILAGPGAAADADLRLRLEILGGDDRVQRRLPPGCALRDGALRRVREAMRQELRLLGLKARPLDARQAGALVALAYPDRIAQRRPSGGFRLASGRGAVLAEGDALAQEPWLVVAEIGGGGADGRIFLAAPIDRAEIEASFAAALETAEEVAWDRRGEAVQARRRRRLGALVLDDAPWDDAPPERVAAALAAGIRSLGLAALPWTDAARNLQARVAFLRRLDGEAAWPDLGDAALEASLETWLAPYLVGMRRRADLAGLDLSRILADRLDPRQRRRLDEEAPARLRVPSGREVTLDYATGEAPALAVKLQELFGLAETPCVAEGRVPVVLHLLSPAGRPVQVTRDLAGFWRGGYAAVRRDLRGRYPRHPWPEDPWTAPPSRGVKRRP
ncbi:MAG TPA: ATP-dependent helicase HrpB [Alphaproteobacteria bacterium]|nr:ATP-dependent helicase HrpB [Alphaproteobacteria bacterium]